MPRREPETRLAHKRRPTVLCTSRKVLTTKDTAFATLYPWFNSRSARSKSPVQSAAESQSPSPIRKSTDFTQNLLVSLASVFKYLFRSQLAEQELLKSTIIRIMWNYFSNAINLMPFAVLLSFNPPLHLHRSVICDDRYLQISKSYIEITYI